MAAESTPVLMAVAIEVGEALPIKGATIRADLGVTSTGVTSRKQKLEVEGVLRVAPSCTRAGVARGS